MWLDALCSSPLFDVRKLISSVIQSAYSGAANDDPSNVTSLVKFMGVLMNLLDTRSVVLHRSSLHFLNEGFDLMRDLSATTRKATTQLLTLDGFKRMAGTVAQVCDCLLYTSPSPRDLSTSRMPSSA